MNLKIDADAGVAFVSTVQYIITIMDSEGSMVVSTYAPAVNGVWKIKSETKQVLRNVIPT
jgi:uncharacterized protein (UPF0333 family)